jgi:SAM-dependent MidA family methyltransferase
MTQEFRPPSTESAVDLAAVIRAEVESMPDRRITFARFMDVALNEPGLGYYRQAADRPTDAGDFLTAPETHPIFGRTVARRIERMWHELGEPRPFEVIEYGAGSGTLGRSILEGLRRRGSPLFESVRYRPIESNPNRLLDLRAGFEKAGLADLLAAAGPQPDGVVPVPGVILANEFLDALPVHRFVVRARKLLELFVEWRDEPEPGFVEVPAEPSTTELAARLADDGFWLAEPRPGESGRGESGIGRAGRLAERQIGEICLGLAPWLDEIAARLARGFVIAIDYGYVAAELYGPRHLAGTLLGYRGHRVVDDPFAQVGRTDLTAHVDFTALERLAERRGFRPVALTTQAEFLIDAGLESELRALQDSPETDAADYLRARSGIVRMLDPRHMGRFRVLVLARNADSGPPTAPKPPGNTPR